MNLKSLLTFLCFMMGINLYGQKQICVDNFSEKKKIKEAAGLWQGVKGTDTFTVLLQASANNDTLLGWHEYKKNGLVESSTMAYKGIYDSMSVLMFVSSARMAPDSTLTFVFSDRNRSQNLFLVRFDVQGSFANWRIFGSDKSEGQYSSFPPGVKPVIPPPSEIMKIKEWRMTKLQ